MLGWAGPALLLLGALFLQSAGLYSATGAYVRWMDELNKASQTDPGGGYLKAFVLDDALSEWLAKLRFLEAPEVPYLAESWIDVATAVLSLVWLCWVVRMQDLSLWTRSLLSGAVLAVLKGLLAWATVLPDPAGWQGCQERLGEDGLAYFRQAASGDAGVGLGQALLDILLLELRGLWVLDHSGRRRVCADTVFSGQASFCILLFAGLFDAVRSATDGLEASRRAAFRGLALLCFGLALLLGLARAAAGSRHYALDVLVAMALAPLAFGSPSVALATSRWVCDSASAPAPAVELLEPASPQPGAQRGLSQASTTALADAESQGPLGPRDLGECGLPPCCASLGGDGGVCFLRADPGVPGLTPWTEECEQRYAHQLAEFKEILAREIDRQSKAEHEIAREHEQVREFSQQLEEQRGERLKAEFDRLAELEQSTLQRAKRELEAARTSAAKLEEKAAKEAKQLARVEADHKMRKSQLTGGCLKYSRKEAEARAECLQHEQSIRESERQLEVLQKFLFRHADPAGDAAREAADEEPCEEPAGPDVPSVVAEEVEG